MGLGDLGAHDGYFVRKPFENLPRKEWFDRRRDVGLLLAIALEHFIMSALFGFYCR